MVGNLLEKLEEKLDELNVEKKDIDFDKALQELVEDKAVLSTFTNLIMTYLGHFINGKHTIENLLENAKDKRIRTFIELCDVINTRYIEKKNKCACVDYNDMISKALEHLEQKNFTSKYKYIFVDEFQDISILRNEMIKELTSLNENACIKVVGDDWQAINKFAGSDVMIIKNFQNHYNDAKRVDLKDTFRFGKTIADISKKFIMKNKDSQISKDINTLKGKESNIYVYWDNYSRKDEKEKNNTAHIRDVIDKLIEKDPQIKEILITGRYKFLLKKEQLEEIKKNYSSIDISFKSVHSSKGLGMDYVIVIGMEEGYNGFPSEKENDPIIDSVLKNEENYPYAEERRLFYVALTRVKKDIVFVSNPKKTSSFLKEIIRDNKDLITELNSNPMSKHDVCPQCNNGYLIEQKQFAYCTDSKFCKYKEKIQPRCKYCNTKLVFDETKKIRYCSNHPSYTVESCKSCDDGYMIDKGSFFACSNYPTEDCKYTVSK
jgi:DNA helicase IV